MPLISNLDAAVNDNRPLNSSELRILRDVHRAVMAFWVIDGVMLTLFGLMGAVPMALGWQFGIVGLLLTVVQVLSFHRSRRDIRALDRNNIGITLTSMFVMLVAVVLVPAVGGLMIMSVLSVIAACSLQLTKGQLGGVYVVCAVAAAGVLMLVDTPLEWPMATLPQRAVTAVWFAWLLAKCAGTNVTGTRMRQLVRQANLELAAALETVRQVASTDELTVLPNRRSIVSDLEGALQRLRAEAGSVGVALLDIDHFKSVNDRYGHAVGDEVLRVFGRLVTASLRPGDRVGRYGGEEFLLVLRDLRHDGAARDATDRMRRAVEAHDWGALAEGLAVTTSAGVAMIGGEESSLSAIQRADAALYTAKASGRNRVVLG